MALSSIQELREKALQFREMAKIGTDVKLRKALLLVAEEFEQEAEKLSRGAAQPDQMPTTEASQLARNLSARRNLPHRC